MPEKKDFSHVSYILGIISIVLAFFQPLAGVILGIIGLTYSKKQKTDLSQRGKKLSIIGIVIGAIIFIATMILALVFTQGVGSLYGNLPIQ